MSVDFILNSGVAIDSRARVAMFSDALDAIGLRNQVMSPLIKPLENKFTIIGFASTLQFIESADFNPDDPYAEAIDFIDALAPSQCVVIATGMGLKSAFWGELFSTAARGRGATGVICDGPVRDTVKIREIGFPTFSNGTRPEDYKGRMRIDSSGQPIMCAGVSVSAGDLIIADEDGVVVVPSERIDEVVHLTNHRASQENLVLRELQQGSRIREVWDKYHVL